MICPKKKEKYLPNSRRNWETSLQREALPIAFSIGKAFRPYFLSQCKKCRPPSQTILKKEANILSPRQTFNRTVKYEFFTNIQPRPWRRIRTRSKSAYFLSFLLKISWIRQQALKFSSSKSNKIISPWSAKQFCMKEYFLKLEVEKPYHTDVW